jgi:DNA-directed RNA polymerase specialized sigma24 family protein
MDKLTDKSKFGSWVNSIAVYVCNRMLKQKINYRRNNMYIYDDDGNMRNKVSELIDFYIPDKIYEDTELRQELKKCIGELDIETRQIVNMRFYCFRTDYFAVT